jgi:ATP adenylyltransferase
MNGSTISDSYPDISCKFCHLATSNVADHPRDRWIAESEHFVVIPSIGALVDGWVLVVPKTHILSLGAIPRAQHAELADLASETSSLLERAYSLPIAHFEHGSTEPSQAIGCGVHHAHLHLVPLDFDVVEATMRLHPSFDMLDHRGGVASVAEVAGSGSYVYLRNGSGREVVVLNTENESQLIRRVIASCLGFSDQWNWREFPQVDRADRFGEQLSVTWERLVGVRA